MLIRCPNCQTGYNLTPQKLGKDGRTVRCVKCTKEWFQGPIKEEKPEEKPPLPPENPQVEAPVAKKATVNDKRQKLQKRLLVSVFTAFIALLVIFSALALLRNSVVSAIPSMQGFYNAIGLAGDSSDETMSVTGLIIPEDSIERVLDEDTTPVTYTFIGKVTNTNQVAVDIPQIRVSLLDDKGVELDFWPAQVEKRTLEPNESSRWVCRFFNPPLDKVSEHKITFVKN